MESLTLFRVNGHRNGHLNKKFRLQITLSQGMYRQLSIKGLGTC